MDKLKYIKLENEDGSYSESIPLAVDSDHVDVDGNTLTKELSYKANNSSINNLQNQINSLASGSPLVASSVSGMTDTTRIYVNSTDGHWYWYNGSTWNDGGTYQSTGIGVGEITYENLDEYLKNTIGIYSTTYTLNDGYYIRQDGQVIEQTGYCYTSPIRLKANQKIKMSGRGANQNVSMITKCNQAGLNLIPLVISVDNTLRDYEYETDTDIYVILSGRTGTIENVYIFDDEEKIIATELTQRLQYALDYSLDYSFTMTNNSPIIYGGTNYIDYSKDFEQGYFSDGVPSSSTTRIRSANYININQKTKLINLLSDSSYRIFIFNTDNTYAGTTDWITDKVYEYDFLDTKKYKFVFKFNNNSDIIPADVLNKFFILSGQEDLENIIKDILDNIDTREVGIVNLDNELQNIIHSSSPVFTNTTGYFVKYNGEITEADNYCYTSPIELKKHQKIRVRAKGANQNVSIISECDLNGNNINPVVICIDSAEHIYSYEAIEDTYVILSSRLNYINDVFIIDNSYKVIENTIDGKIQDGYDYSILLNNNSPVVYGGTTLNDYSKDFEQGYFSDGVPSTSTGRIRSANYININQKTKLINLLNDSSYRIFIYNTDNSYEGTTDWITNKVYEYNFLNNKKYKFAFKFNDNSDITPSDLVNKFYVLSGQNDLKTALQDVLDIDDTEYPAYWESTINNKVEQINSLIKEYTENNNDLSLFFLIGDPHYPSHNYVTSKLIKYLSKKCGINLSICLGDLIEDSTEGHEQNLSRIQDAMNQLQYGIDRMLLTQGNHDNGAGIVDGNGQIKFARVVPDNEWIHHTSSKLLVTPKIVFDELGKAFYYDDEINKIRFISLDSFENKSYTVDSNDVITSSDLGSCTNRQINWLVNNALNNIPSGYGIITFSHKPLYHPVINNQEIARTELTINGSAVITAINNFKNNGGNYIAHLSGHQHHDFLDNLNNIPQVVNLNDGKHWRQKSYWGSQADLVGDSPLKISGTTNECAFDAVIINKTTRHVDLIRIGAGSDREFNY